MAPLKTVMDQMNRMVTFSFPPKRIISLVPSQTELLFDLDLGDSIVGVTKFCVHPKELVKSIPKIGGTKKFDFEKIKFLKPDLIIGNKEENYEKGINELSQDFPVWMSDVKTLEDACLMIGLIGQITNKSDCATTIITEINKRLSKVSSVLIGSVAYLIWNDPIMVAGKNTFIHEMLGLAGFKNIFVDLDRYPVVSSEQLRNSAPDFIFLSTEPYPFKEKHLGEMKKRYPKVSIKLVDGEIFSWYGSRLLKAQKYFDNIRAEIQQSTI